MINIILSYLLLNVPEGIIVSLLALSDVKFKNNVQTYVKAILSSAFIIYVVPELFPVIPYAQIYMVFALFVLFNFGFGLKTNKVTESIFLHSIITGFCQVITVNIIMNTISINHYFSLDVLSRFTIMLPSFIVSILLSILYVKTKGVVNMKKFWFLGKTEKRKRGE